MLLYGQLISKLVTILSKKLSTTKIVRIILLFFENLLDIENFNEMIVLFGIYPILEELLDNKITDDELKVTLSILYNKLSNSVKILSSLERYQQEISSDKLSKGPTHTSLFWKKYSTRFDDNNYELIKKLIKLLGSNDNETVALACYDLGQWSIYYPDGKRILTKLGAKLKLMTLITHNDKNVKNQALIATQKLLIKNWQQIDNNNDKKDKDKDDKKQDE